MKILISVYHQILKFSAKKPSEIGGIIGGKNNIIEYVYFDINTSIHSYAPNTNRLNDIISVWRKQSIEFFGIFHSHLDTSERLSNADEKYIKEIMYAMPEEIHFLYFPLILPKCKKMIVFKAIRKNNMIDIIKDDVKIIK